jgi:hypothetical protein
VRSREIHRLIRNATLVAVLLFAQAAVAAHVDLDDSHPAGDSCALCAGHSVLGTGNVGGVTQTDAVALEVQFPAVEQARESQSHRCYFLARGPPAAS